MVKMIHTGLTLERWSKFSVFEQLANVGTDIVRALAFWQQYFYDFNYVAAIQKNR